MDELPTLVLGLATASLTRSLLAEDILVDGAVDLIGVPLILTTLLVEDDNTPAFITGFLVFLGVVLTMDKEEDGVWEEENEL